MGTISKYEDSLNMLQLLFNNVTNIKDVINQLNYSGLTPLDIVNRNPRIQSTSKRYLLLKKHGARHSWFNVVCNRCIKKVEEHLRHDPNVIKQVDSNGCNALHK